MPVFSPTPAYTVNDFKSSEATERENGDLGDIRSDDLSQSTMKGTKKILDQSSTSAGLAEAEAKERMPGQKPSSSVNKSKDKVEVTTERSDFGHGPTHADALPTEGEKPKSSFHNGHVDGSDSIDVSEDKDERLKREGADGLGANGRQQQTTAENSSDVADQDDDKKPTVGSQKKQHARGTEIDDEWEAKAQVFSPGLEPQAAKRDSGTG